MKKKPRKPCSVPKCVRIHRSHGYCQSHAEQYKRGKTNPRDFVPFLTDKEPCVIIDCDRPRYAKTLCRTHYGVCHSFSLTPEALQDMYSRGCDVCGGNEAVIHIDHDHECCPGTSSCGDCVRGGLCGRCNLVLGAVRDDKSLLNRLAGYLP